MARELLSQGSRDKLGSHQPMPEGRLDSCHGHQPSFIGRRIVLVPPAREHYPLLHRWCSDPRSMHLWTNSRRVTGFEQFAFEMDQLLAQNLVLLVAGKRSGELHGFVQTYGSNPFDGVVSILVYIKEGRRRLRHRG